MFDFIGKLLLTPLVRIEEKKKEMAEKRRLDEEKKAEEERIHYEKIKRIRKEESERQMKLAIERRDRERERAKRIVEHKRKQSSIFTENGDIDYMIKRTDDRLEELKQKVVEIPEQDFNELLSYIASIPKEKVNAESKIAFKGRTYNILSILEKYHDSKNS